ncbi:MAG TPA: nuclear transport factor 2 family protein [Aliidongia sp.]|nr:nuclear transport factor 2 family protein [Aliidongia sp.]
MHLGSSTRLGVTACLSVVASLLADSISCRAEEPLKAALQSRYAAMKAAVADRDGTAFASLLAPRFKSIDVSGRAKNADQIVAELKRQAADPNRSSETTLVSLKPEGAAVTVEQRYEMKTIKVAADGAPRAVQLVTVSTDRWVKPADVWLIERSVTTELTYSEDGDCASSP